MSEKENKDLGLVKLANVRLSFPKLFKPEAYGNGVPKYSASFLIDPSTANGKNNEKMLRRAIAEVCEAKWGKGKVPKIKDDHKCDGDGNEKDYDGYEDMVYVGAGERRPPVLIDRNRSPLNETVCMTEHKLYAGCYVNALIQIWAYDTKTEEGMPVKGYGANLRVVQYAGPGEEFGGGKTVNVDDHFDDLGDDEDDL